MVSAQKIEVFGCEDPQLAEQRALGHQVHPADAHLADYVGERHRGTYLDPKSAERITVSRERRLEAEFARARRRTRSDQRHLPGDMGDRAKTGAEYLLKVLCPADVSTPVLSTLRDVLPTPGCLQVHYDDVVAEVNETFS
jgi:hypothetical protein